MCRLCILQKLAVRGFYTGTGYAPFVAAAELAVKVRQSLPLVLLDINSLGVLAAAGYTAD